MITKHYVTDDGQKKLVGVSIDGLTEDELNEIVIEAGMGQQRAHEFRKLLKRQVGSPASSGTRSFIMLGNDWPWD